MMPDKIYLNKYMIRPGMLRQAHYPADTPEFEYIRKDALLEVIATAREAAVIQKNFNNCPVEQEARIDAYDYIMNKIESL